MQKDRCIWQMYFFCKTEWRKFQTIAIQHLFHPPELNRGVCGNPSNAGSWKIALKHANSWKGRRMKCYWDFHWSCTETKCNRCIWTNQQPWLHSLCGGGYNTVFATQPSEGAGLQDRTWTAPPSVTELCLPWVSFPNYMELARALNPAGWLTAAW